MRFRGPFIACALLLISSSALALRAAPVDAGSGDRLPTADAGVVDAGATVAPTPDTGAYPDTGCPDGVCCLVLPNWDGSDDFDAGPVDTGRRRRRAAPPVDAGQPPESGGLFGCSASGASSLLWLLPLVAARRRRRG